MSVDIHVDDRAGRSAAQLTVQVETVDGLQRRLGHAYGTGVNLARAVVVDRTALPHAKVGGAVRPLDVKDLKGL